MKLDYFVLLPIMAILFCVHASGQELTNDDINRYVNGQEGNVFAGDQDTLQVNGIFTFSNPTQENANFIIRHKWNGEDWVETPVSVPPDGIFTGFDYPFAPANVFGEEYDDRLMFVQIYSPNGERIYNKALWFHRVPIQGPGGNQPGPGGT